MLSETKYRNPFIGSAAIWLLLKVDCYVLDIGFCFFILVTFASMYIHCSDKELIVFEKIAQAAAKLDLPCYLIGGFVRDKIIGRKTKDIDIVCIGDGIALAEEVAKHLNQNRK